MLQETWEWDLQLPLALRQIPPASPDHVPPLPLPAPQLAAFPKHNRGKSRLRDSENTAHPHEVCKNSR